MPAPGQGILAIEAKSGDAETVELLQRIDVHACRIAAEAERMFSTSMGGGCKTPVGSHAEIAGDRLTLWGMVAQRTGGTIVRASIDGAAADRDSLAALLADRMHTDAPWHRANQS